MIHPAIRRLHPARPGARPLPLGIGLTDLAGGVSEASPALPADRYSPADPWDVPPPPPRRPAAPGPRGGEIPVPRPRAPLASRRARRSVPPAGTPVDASPTLLTAPCWAPERVRPVRTPSPITREAQKHLGRPYRWGGTSLERGADCSGFAWGVYRRTGLPVPLSWFRSERDPRANPRRLEQHGMRLVTRPRPGDVVIFGRQHVGIYLGDVKGRGLYVGANHGGRHRQGRIDIMPIESVGIRPVFYRYAPGTRGPLEGPWKRAPARSSCRA